MKMALAFAIAAACFMIPTQALAAQELNQQKIILDYTEKICSITH
jgi:hypothetical protein